MSAYVNKRHTPLLKNDCAPMHHEPEAKKGRDSHKIARLRHAKHMEVDKHQASLSRPGSNIVSCPLGDSQPLIPAHISHPYSSPSAHFPAPQNYICSNPPFAKPQPSTIHHGSLQSTPHHPSAIHQSSTPRRVGPPSPPTKQPNHVTPLPVPSLTQPPSHKPVAASMRRLLHASAMASAARPRFAPLKKGAPPTTAPKLQGIVFDMDGTLW